MPPPGSWASDPTPSCDCTCPPTTGTSLFAQVLASQSQFSTVRSQWESPNNILTLLMIIGGDTVQRAVAQLSGHTSYFVPTAFSFGWVGYSTNAVLQAIGEGRLMPASDCSSILVNARNGYAKANQSWILGRIVRDHRTQTEDKGLTLTFFKTSPITKHMTPGVPHRDWVYWTSVLVIVVQFGVAVIPGAVSSKWITLIVTAAGTILALAGGALPQWKNEKWACRKLKTGGNDREVICLTRGNGSKDVIVIVNEGEGQLRLEDLAGIRDSRARYTMLFTTILAILWFVLLLTVAGLQSNAWYLLAVGSIGMVQNYIVAGVRRSPRAFGIHLQDKRDVHNDKVFRALQAAEEVERGVGLSLLPVFFPGGLREDEEEWRIKRLATYEEMDKKRKEIKKAEAQVANNYMLHRHPIEKMDP